MRNPSSGDTGKPYAKPERVWTEDNTHPIPPELLGTVCRSITKHCASHPLDDTGPEAQDAIWLQWQYFGARSTDKFKRSFEEDHRLIGAVKVPHPVYSGGDAVVIVAPGNFKRQKKELELRVRSVVGVRSLTHGPKETKGAALKTVLNARLLICEGTCMPLIPPEVKARVHSVLSNKTRVLADLDRLLDGTDVQLLKGQRDPGARAVLGRRDASAEHLEDNLRAVLQELWREHHLLWRKIHHMWVYAKGSINLEVYNFVILQEAEADKQPKKRKRPRSAEEEATLSERQRKWRAQHQEREAGAAPEVPKRKKPKVKRGSSHQLSSLFGSVRAAAEAPIAGAEAPRSFDMLQAMGNILG